MDVFVAAYMDVFTAVLKTSEEYCERNTAKVAEADENRTHRPLFAGHWF